MPRTRRWRREPCRWVGSDHFLVCPTPGLRGAPGPPIHISERWEARLAGASLYSSTSTSSSVAVHNRQSTSFTGPDDVLGEPIVAHGEAAFTLSYLQGSGTHARIGVAAADGSGQTWGVRLYDGSLEVDSCQVGADDDGAFPAKQWLKVGFQGGGSSPLLRVNISVTVNMATRSVAFSVGEGMPVEPEGGERPRAPRASVPPHTRLRSSHI
jgi:hypothetical protein